MRKVPDLSVVMSVCNGQKYLEKSIDSVLSQTFRNFEFIIINDGSCDNTGDIIERFAADDQRIVPIHQENKGLTKSLNIAISRANGAYIARQDADDTSLPARFEKQMSFLKTNPGVVLCGTWFLEINEDTGSRERRYPTDDDALRENIKFVNNFCHPSVIFSKSAFEKAGGYDENFKTAQDFELWIRIAKYGTLANISEILVHKRIGFGNTVSWEKRLEKGKVVKDIISKHFGSACDIGILNFLRYYFPLIIYGYIPVPLLKFIRRIRYS